MPGQPDKPDAAWVTHPWVAEGADGVRFGIANGPRHDWPALREFVGLLEELGFDSYWSNDHPVHFPECWTTLAAVAVATSRIRLGSLVTNVYHRNPLLLARIVADVDRISGGRVVLGLGIGDFDAEFAAMGLPFPSARERQAALEETVGVLRGLWGEAPLAPPGPRFGVDSAALTPPPAQRPRVPLLIGGAGEKVTLRQVARFADACNYGTHFWTGNVRAPDDVRHKQEVVRGHCEAVGRPYDAVLQTHLTLPLLIAERPGQIDEKIERFIPPLARKYAMESMVAGTPAEVAAYFVGLRRAGLRYFLATVYGDDRETIRLLAERVIPEVEQG